MRQHLGSSAYQVTKALQGVYTPGESRCEGKATGAADGHIYSRGTMQTYVESATRFAEWVRARYGVKDIRQITPEHGQAYLADLASRERSGGYIGKEKSAIGKISVALHGERWDLGPGWHSDRRPERVYTPAQAQAIIASLRAHARDPQLADVAMLQTIAGLRREEAARLRGQDIDVPQCTVSPDKGTKGGRPRTVQVDRQHQGYLQALQERADRHRDGFVFQGRASLAARAERAVDEACARLGFADQGTHGFRRAFAQERHEEYQGEGLSDRQARQRVARDLGHGRVEVTLAYVPRQ